MSGKKTDILLKNALVILESGAVKANLAVKDGKTAGILDPSVEVEADEIRDLNGKIIFPGLIDTHAHYWEPGPFNYREDFYHATRVCAAGGITTTIEMPLSVPPVVDKKTFEMKYEIAKKNSVVDFALWGGLIPTSVDQIEEMNGIGCCAFKAFISFASPEYPRIPDHDLCRAMEITSKFGGLIGVHAENAEIVDDFCRRKEAEGIRQPSRYHEGRPPFSELEAIERATLFARQYNARVLICHMSAVEGFEATNRERACGRPVYTETCPHYLAFDNTKMDEIGPFAKCNPPLRPAENREKLWEHIRCGDIDVIGTDHGPYSKEEKAAASDNIWQALCGFGGADMDLPVLLTEGYHKRGITLERIAKISSINAARIFGLKSKGAIEVGNDADYAIVDLNSEWVYDGMKTFSKTKLDCGPYQGYRAKGRILETMVRGKTVYRDGEIKVDSGYGKFISGTKMPKGCEKE